MDILGGRCVRLSQGDYDQQKVYNATPLEVAKAFEAHGLQRLHLVDLDGARSQHIVNYKVLEQIAAHTKLAIDFSGGIKSSEAIRTAFGCGAAQVSIGSAAVRDRALFLEWLQEYGPDKILLGADCRWRRIATNGWLEHTSIDILDFVSDYYEQGVRSVICTDIGQDGMLQGPALELYKDILGKVPVSLIASGGIASLADLEALKQAGCAGAIIGKALYEGRITLKELERLC